MPAVKVRPAALQYNHNRVPQKVWLKWSVTARTVFNRTYDFMMNNQGVMLHPKMEKPSPQHWKTICWNAAWIAADAVDNALPTDVENTDGTTVKVKGAAAGR